MDYLALDEAGLRAEQQRLQKEIDAFAARGLKLDMSRGKPSPAQLDLSMGLLSVTDVIDEDGLDTRNYGAPAGSGEARRFFAELLGVAADEVMVAGNSSLNVMYNMVDLGWRYGFEKGAPWQAVEKPKFLCPTPGYDRHFRVTEVFGFELVTVPMTPGGPDMDVVEKLVKDPAVKGMWCVPVYSNPEGVVYSAETVRRMAKMETAPDFRIFWDNAYGSHHLTEEALSCPNILDECRAAGNEDRPLLFCSTSKITFAGAGVAAMAASEANMATVLGYYAAATIGFDKVNQLRHVRYLKQEGGIAAHMEKHRAILAPKFQMVLEAFRRELAPCGEIARWGEPKGGYFISLFTMDGCAARVIDLCKAAGLVLTGVGAAFPYGKDPADSLVRIAPSYPEAEELKEATELLCLAVRLASVEKLMRDRA